MFNIGSLIPKVIRKAGIKDKVKSGQAINYFKKLKDFYLEDQGERVRVMYLKNNILVVASLSDKAVSKLQENEKKILNKINKEFGEGIIKKIRYLT